MTEQFSPDGRWWWDGAQWHPVPPPGSGPMPGYGPGPSGQFPPRWSRTPWIVVLVAVVVAAIAVPVALLVGGGHHDKSAHHGSTLPTSSGATSSGAASPTPTLTPGAPVTQAMLDKIGPDFFWSMLRRQMTQPLEVLTSTYFDHSADFTAHRPQFVHRIGIDHKTGRFTYGEDSYWQGRPESMNRCVNGKGYYWESYEKTWNHLAASDGDCQKPSPTASADDGIVDNGMTGAQADKVLESLRGQYKGFGRPGKPTLIRAGGKTYIREIVDFKPLKLADGNYWGAQIFTWAFKASGLDPQTWYWYQGLGGGEGVHAVYYVDPASLLPVTSIQRTTPVLDKNGKSQERYDQTQLFGYTFPKTLPPGKASGPTYTFTMPEGWKLP